MHAQVAERTERLAAPTARGDAALRRRRGRLGRRHARRCSRASARCVVDGGPTLNPSTYELLAGIHDVAAEEVVVLPNSANVIMAAERAAELSEKAVRVVPTRSQQAGLAVSVELDPTAAPRRTPRRWTQALERLRTGGVAPGRARGPGRAASASATRSASSTSELVAWGEPEATLRDGARARSADGAELVTLIAGDGAPLDGAAVAALAPDGVEIECRRRRPARAGGGCVAAE